MNRIANSTFKGGNNSVLDRLIDRMCVGTADGRNEVISKVMLVLLIDGANFIF